MFRIVEKRERWLSGLKRTPGERVAAEKLLGSSNLPLSAIFENKVFKNGETSPKILKDF